MPERHLGAGSSSATSRSDAACLTCVDGVIAGFRTPRPGIRSDYRPVHSLCVNLCAVRRLVVIELVTGITCPAARATMQAAARPRLRGSGQSSDCFVCLEPDAGRPCLRARPAAAGSGRPAAPPSSRTGATQLCAVGPVERLPRCSAGSIHQLDDLSGCAEVRLPVSGLALLAASSARDGTERAVVL